MSQVYYCIPQKKQLLSLSVIQSIPGRFFRDKVIGKRRKVLQKRSCAFRSKLFVAVLLETVEFISFCIRHGWNHNPFRPAPFVVTTLLTLLRLHKQDVHFIVQTFASPFYTPTHCNLSPVFLAAAVFVWYIMQLC